MGCFFTDIITIAKKFYLLSCSVWGATKKRSKGHREKDLQPRHYDQIFSFGDFVKTIAKSFPPSVDLYKRFIKTDLSPPACFLATEQTNFFEHVAECPSCHPVFCDYLPDTIETTTSLSYRQSHSRMKPTNFGTKLILCFTPTLMMPLSTSLHIFLAYHQSILVWVCLTA